MRNLEGEHMSNELGGQAPQQQEPPLQSQQNLGYSTGQRPQQGAQWNASGPECQGYPGPAGGGTSSQGEGLAPNIAAMLSYLLFGWIGGLIMYLTQTDREVRFHAAQSILTFGGLNVICWGMWGIEVWTVFAGSFLFIMPFYWLFSLLSFVLWIFLSVQGYQLKHTRMPFVGAIAERWAMK